MNSLIHTMINRALALIFPDRCVGCGERGQMLCRNCALRAKRPTREKKSVLFLDKLYYWGIYENRALRSALRRFKYHGTYGLAEPFSDMLAELVRPDLHIFNERTLVMPIPAHTNPLPQRKNSS
jgi:predicted amidophosphoribosyltransferase